MRNNPGTHAYDPPSNPPHRHQKDYLIMRCRCFVSPFILCDAKPSPLISLDITPRSQADVIVARQAALERYWSREGMNLTRAGVSLEDLRAALVLVSAVVRCLSRRRLLWGRALRLRSFGGGLRV
jgi:hypothetical protein